jgi:hypothetical protein
MRRYESSVGKEENIMHLEKFRSLLHELDERSTAYSALADKWSQLDSMLGDKVYVKDMHMVRDRTMTLENGTSIDIPSQLKDKVVATNARVMLFGYAPSIESFSSSSSSSSSTMITPSHHSSSHHLNNNNNNNNNQLDQELILSVSKWNLDENKNHFSSLHHRHYDISGMSAEDILLKQGWVVIDSVFTPRALTSLVQVCDESTSYFDLKRGYYGGYLSDGFADGLMFQASSLFRERMPRTIGSEILSQVWAYKYDSTVAQGIRMHIDQGMYTINCWLRPDDAIEDQYQLNKTGGLRIFPGSQRIIANNKDFRRANRDFRFLEVAIKDMAKDRAEKHNQNHGTQSTTNSSFEHDDGSIHFIDIPHRENRCLLFTSDLVHETSPIKFKKGFKNRRLNFVLMFGLSEHLRSG